MSRHSKFHEQGPVRGLGFRGTIQKAAYWIFTSGFRVWGEVWALIKPSNGPGLSNRFHQFLWESSIYRSLFGSPGVQA